MREGVGRTLGAQQAAAAAGQDCSETTNPGWLAVGLAPAARSLHAPGKAFRLTGQPNYCFHSATSRPGFGPGSGMATPVAASGALAPPLHNNRRPFARRKLTRAATFGMSTAARARRTPRASPERSANHIPQWLRPPQPSGAIAFCTLAMQAPDLGSWRKPERQR